MVDEEEQEGKDRIAQNHQEKDEFSAGSWVSELGSCSQVLEGSHVVVQG